MLAIILCTKDNGNYKSVHKLKYSVCNSGPYVWRNDMCLSFKTAEAKQTNRGY